MFSISKLLLCVCLYLGDEVHKIQWGGGGFDQRISDSTQRFKKTKKFKNQ